ncbi:GlsB/YeaQ/YmgE family stress response membrane protein [Gordonia amarae]|uniref:Transglycosylase associated protein n=2 Tax=Gordonia amarae TaxID=36821 RepID=G7GQL4_9ACTN|nr:GlsB/YeaQ/YmgE family stress response membrane protein [Gordonia amarae]MCS3880188.1 putative membrane protein YeaQ/YmgE (transglycosylase-associated protein family) [Gordonia amarae]QHN18547.1 GlsB/YeaQ/YmgE family stress response membrane protein [Gordonia amarae]QHN23030.1 GlsB/YeaQ/YmgE family stress response membrane protein [Gordonia amarae]QHN31931.1 GlsB/YeaQ/YmgE family stress response membrane protein [Gordonia amarae]QHN40678.1 GlsB/YeaQ/YmgE family stress response membrane prote
MLALGFFGWIIIGGLAGWIAGKIMDDKNGLVLNIVFGIIGGLIGGFLLKLIGVDVEGGGMIFSFVTCLAGACLVLWIGRLVGARTGR